ncbi:hypothetical protein SL1157_2901 [Ruegeria lacuscaerulensis ITI-1157]|nr:hypothetical protein SL1157_2901 [Ruegeria lacuscaerulensis ITI-1157]
MAKYQVKGAEQFRDRSRCNGPVGSSPDEGHNANVDES